MPILSGEPRSVASWALSASTPSTIARASDAGESGVTSRTTTGTVAIVRHEIKEPGRFTVFGASHWSNLKRNPLTVTLDHYRQRLSGRQQMRRRG